MDPLSLVASIAGIAGFTDTVVTKTYKYITEAKNTDQSIRRFFAEGQSLLWVLTGIQHTLKLMSEDNIQIQTNVGKQIDICLNVVKEIRDILVDPELHKSSIGKFKRHLKWPFDATKTEELTRYLERQKTTLSLAFSTETWLNSFESSKIQTADMRALHGLMTEKFLSEEHQKIFKWLGNVDHWRLQENGITLRRNLREQTGKWFLEGSKFTHWLDTRGAKLWVHGIPGSGKTVLTSTIIQHIHTRIQDSPSRTNHDALAYFYCDFREEKTKSVWNIIGSLIKQLAQQNRECFYDLEDFYRKHDPLGISTKPCNIDDLSQLLRQMARKFDGDVIIVVDGLDEVEKGRAETIELLKSLGSGNLQGSEPSNSAELESDHHITLLNTPNTGVGSSIKTATVLKETSLLTDCGTENGADILNFQKPELSVDASSLDLLKKEGSACIKMLFVSRTLADIETELEDFEKQTIKAEERDLLLYVSSEIHHRMNKGTLRFNDRSLKEEIVDGLIQNAQGMFRWVSCQIDHLCKLTSDKDKRNALGKLPQGLPQTYDRILMAVDERHVEIVHKTLQWIISATEPLPMEALLDALAVADGDNDLDEEAKIQEDTLLECCSSLVKKSQSIQGALELAHFSVKQYLLEISTKSPPEIHRYQIKEDWSRILLAQTCLTYLNFRSFDKRPAKTLVEFDSRIAKRPFIRHAALWWDSYADGNLTVESVKRGVQTLFSPTVTAQFRFWNQCLMVFGSEREIDLDNKRYKIWLEASPLHWASLLALPEVTEFLMQSFLPNQDSEIGTPIHCAFLGRGLLPYGLSSSALENSIESENWGTTIFYDTENCAICSGRLGGYLDQSPLIRHGMSMYSFYCMLIRDKSWRAGTRLRTVKILIKNEIDLNFQSTAFPDFDMVSISLNITEENSDFVSHLLQRGAKVSRGTIKHAQKLIDATKENMKPPDPGVAVLINNTTEKNLSDSDRDAFKEMVACFRNTQDDGTKLLAEKRLVQAMTATERRQTSQDLRGAVKLGLTLKVKTFLEKLVDSPVTQGLSEPLQETFYLAVERNWREIAELFLKSGVKVDRKSFSIAMSKGSSRIVDLLLDYDPTVALQEDLFKAIELGEHGIFLSLRRVGIETSATDEYSQLPIHRALKDDGQAGSQGRLAIIEDLVNLEPSLTASNSDGELPIHLAARLGLDEIVKIFLSRGSPVDASNGEGKRPTHLACFKDATKTLELLIAAGVDINAKRSGVGGGPLHYAASYGSRGCTRLLIEAGADIEQLSSSQYTPLVLASIKKAWGPAEELIRAGANVNLMEEETRSTILAAASAAGATDIVSLLLDQHPDLDLESPSLDGESPLLLATTYGHSEIVELLLRFGAKVDANRDGYAADTPLHRSIVIGSLSLVQLLLDHNANIESVNSALQKPLLLAALEGQWQIAERLIVKGAQLNVKDNDKGYTPLITAAESGEVDIVKLLLSRQVDVNEATTVDNYTALMMAARKGSLPTIKVLVENGADINIQDKTPSCSTALLHATRREAPDAWTHMYGQIFPLYPVTVAGDIPKNPGVEVVEYLLEKGANACDKEADSEMSALMMAASNGDKAIVRALLASGAAVDVQTRQFKETAISLAVDNSKPDICKILLEHGIDLSLTDSIGRNIAHHIARAANGEILNYFLPYGVDWKRAGEAEFFDFEKDCGAGQYGAAPLHLAAKYNFVGFIHKLHDLKLLEDLDPQCGGNLKPLHFAAFAGSCAAIEALLARGADVNAVTTLKGRTPLHWAASRGHSQAALALIRGGANVKLLDKDGCSSAALTSEPAILHELKAASIPRDSAIHNSSVTPTEVASERNIPADPRALKLIKACEEGDLVLCRQLISLGVDCNGSSDSDSPLLVAMGQPLSPRYTDLIAILIESGADINCHASSKVGRHGYQPIHYAVWNDSHDILRKLLTKNARMSDFGLEPIHIAAFQGRTACMAILLDYECVKSGGSAKRILEVQVVEQDQFPKKCLCQDVYAVGNLSTGTALHLAAYAGKDEALSMLIKYGADVNSMNARGLTPLHLAVKRRKIKTVTLLLDAGADVSIRTRRGLSPFLISVMVGQTEIMEELILRSSDIMAVDTYGQGAAYHSLMKGTPEMLSRLQELGIPFNLRNIHGRTPLEAGFLDGFLPEAKDTINFFIQNTPLFESRESPHGNTLNKACAFGASSALFIRPILKRLLEEETPETVSACINNYCGFYGTPLYAASYRGEVEAMDMLLGAGANLASARGPLGSALNGACAMGRVNAVRWLLQHDISSIRDEAMQLASKYTFLTKLLNQYKDRGAETLTKEPEAISIQKLPVLNADPPFTTTRPNSGPEDMAPTTVTPTASGNKDLGLVKTIVKEESQHVLYSQQYYQPQTSLTSLTREQFREVILSHEVIIAIASITIISFSIYRTWGNR